MVHFFKYILDFRYPWMCSLKEAGFFGRHRCGVTLLSGQFPPWSLVWAQYIQLYIEQSPGKNSREVVMVSSAHCNFVCKVSLSWINSLIYFRSYFLQDSQTSRKLEICCCRNATEDSSCINVGKHLKAVLFDNFSLTYLYLPISPWPVTNGFSVPLLQITQEHFVCETSTSL